MPLPTKKTNKIKPSSKNNSKFYQSNTWRSLRKIVLKRDNYQCTHMDNQGRRCKQMKNLEVDHINPIDDTILWQGIPVNHGALLKACEIANLQTLCRHHHAVKRGQERHKGGGGSKG